MNVWSVSVGMGDHEVHLSCQSMGEDLNISIMACVAHVGAVALAIPRPSLEDPQQWSSSVSVLCVTGHKEDELARKIAGSLSAQHHCRVVVTAGLHIDHASQTDIALLMENCSQCVSKLSEWLLASAQSTGISGVQN